MARIPSPSPATDWDGGWLAAWALAWQVALDAPKPFDVQYHITLTTSVRAVLPLRRGVGRGVAAMRAMPTACAVQRDTHTHRSVAVACAGRLGRCSAQQASLGAVKDALGKSDPKTFVTQFNAAAIAAGLVNVQLTSAVLSLATTPVRPAGVSAQGAHAAAAAVTLLPPLA